MKTPVMCVRKHFVSSWATTVFFAAVTFSLLSTSRAQESGAAGPGLNYDVVDNVSVSFVNGSESAILVTWDPAPLSTTMNITGYRVYYSQVAVNTRTSMLLDEGRAEQFVDVPGRESTSFEVDGLVKDATYQFEVITINDIMDGQELERECLRTAVNDFDILIATVMDEEEECISEKLYIKKVQAIGGIVAAILCTVIVYSLVLCMVCCCYSLSHRSVNLLKKEVLRCDEIPDYQTRDVFVNESGSLEQKSELQPIGDSIATNPAFDTSIDRYIDEGLNDDTELSPVSTEENAKTVTTMS